MAQSISHSPTVLVTGATDGIGYATARRFVDEGAAVYLHAQDPDSGEKAMTLLVKDGAEPLRLNLVVADFTRLDEVARLADTLAATLPTLDVLVNNAAVAAPEGRTYTADGHELTFQVNYLAPYLLTTKLVPRLAGVGGRVVNVSSLRHSGGNINWKNPAGDQYWPLAAYAQSKLALTMYTKSLAEAGGDSFIALSVHPGVFQTRLLRMYGRVGRPPEEAAPIITTLGSPTYPVVDGGYYDGLSLAKAAALVENPRARSRLEKLSVHLVESALR
ncbi:SDR family NAD(P)-dependent oxidoreductase [Mycobacterium interjectum]|uniref:SDR family NAD(P)-dependent oxidoreductase n=1 Tax=Mycobacterium interjectum TaxID=33895 RepID=UPI000A0455A7|nr:SDR family NAD(P)-dependent oxidoreductase [Mycobacterium interjectum]MCV7089299.1 SDR family NAD(P)-dependent oxidoreductase [Mycobacterium interjectum]